MAEKKLTIDSSMADFKRAYAAKRKLIEREREDFLFALGDQWTKEEKNSLQKANIKPVVDNRIAPLIYLVTGLQRQNRTDFKAFPEGEEDGLKSEIATALFKHASKGSDFPFKFSEQFKNGVTCGEDHLEPYLDWTQNILNAKAGWRGLPGNCVFPDPSAKEYDFSDGRFVYKITRDLSKDDLIALFPEKESVIKKAKGGKIDFNAVMSNSEKHSQGRDYPKSGDSEDEDEDEDECFDLIERYYKKWVTKYFVGDKQTGELKESESKELAEGFIAEYETGIQQNQMAYEQALAEAQMAQAQGIQAEMPPAPPQQMPGRFVVLPRKVAEIWCFAHTPSIDKPLADELAWFYPKWKKFPIIPYFARFSTAPLEGDDRHLLIQGVTYGLKGSQEKHNKSEVLMLRHLNASTNSGWLTEEGSWVDPIKVEEAGSNPAVNLEYKQGRPKPERIYPMALSQAHAQLSEMSAESIKSQSGINADLLAAQEGGTDSGRAIALRTKQGLVMVQEMFDNASRTQMIAGKFLLSQLGELYDTETAKKVLGEAFLIKNFPPPMMLVEDAMGNPMMDDQTGEPQQQPMPGKDGQPMKYDEQLAEVAIGEVLAGDLGEYDVSIGESVASETMRIANSMELKDFASTFPGLLPPELFIEESALPQSTKNRAMNAIKQQQAMMQAQAAQPKGPQKPKQQPDQAA